MNNRSFTLLISILTVLLSAGCSKHVLKLGDFQKATLNPKNGDKLIFEGFSATFRGENPCVQKGADLTECTLKIPDEYGIYLYDCDHDKCADPEIEVGSISKARKKYPRLDSVDSLRGVSPDKTVAIPCHDNKIVPDPQERKIQKGLVIGWVRNGSGNQILTKWKVEPNDFCEDTGTAITETHSYCKVKSTPGTYQYTVTSTSNPAGCNPSDPAKITIE